MENKTENKPMQRGVTRQLIAQRKPLTSILKVNMSWVGNFLCEIKVIEGELTPPARDVAIFCTRRAVFVLLIDLIGFYII